MKHFEQLQRYPATQRRARTLEKLDPQVCFELVVIGYKLKHRKSTICHTEWTQNMFEPLGMSSGGVYTYIDKCSCGRLCVLSLSSSGILKKT